MLKIAPEGFIFIGAFFLLTVAVALAIGPKWAAIPLCLTLFMVYFFRDPDRAVPPEPGFVSAADGTVVTIRKEREDRFLKAEVLKISVFMSPLNVHVNRAPCHGTVSEVLHTPGGFSAAYKDEASLKNESTAMVLECEGGPILVKQVAGFLARRTVCRVRAGDRLDRGERFGMIKFSSRLDHYLPADAEVKVALNDKVKAGETILAVLPEKR